MDDNHKLYKILDVSKDATEDQIKNAYKKKAMQYHPDKNRGDPECATKFKEISNAYNILGDKDKREKYDACGDNNYNEGSNDNMRSHQDIFEAFFRGHEHGFGDSFFGFGAGGGGRRGNRQQQKADSIESVFNLTLEDIYDGVKKDLSIKLKKYCTNCNTECPDCDGKGIIHKIQSMGIMQTIFQSQCNKCGGEGIIIKGKSNCKLCSGNGYYNKDITDKSLSNFSFCLQYDFISNTTNVIFGEKDNINSITFSLNDELENDDNLSPAFVYYNLSTSNFSYIKYIDSSNKTFYINKNLITNPKEYLFIITRYDNKIVGNDKAAYELLKFVKFGGYDKNSVNLSAIYNILYSIDNKKNSVIM